MSERPELISINANDVKGIVEIKDIVSGKIYGTLELNENISEFLKVFRNHDIVCVDGKVFDHVEPKRS